jgi:polysaccharide pyruvyl transferase WcaK-like protein
MFRALEALGRRLLKDGRKVLVVCNDPMDLPTARTLFEHWLPTPVSCPETTAEYFHLLSESSAVVSGRLHTAVVAFSLGIPFLLMDVDQRTHGFISTYQLQDRAVDPSLPGIEGRLEEQAQRLLSKDMQESWRALIHKRDEMHARAMDLMREALRSG